jgi:predicted nucleotidyltransferase
VLGDGFHAYSDIDVMVEGLPPEDLLKAVKLAENIVNRSVDLKCAEDFGFDLRERLLRISKALKK